VIATLWFKDINIGLIIGVALIVNLTCAALAGLGIPFLLERMQIDAAHAGTVVLTTITDVIGFMVFLGLGTIFLL
jgi:magnesium transporter